MNAHGVTSQKAAFSIAVVKILQLSLAHLELRVLEIGE
jgi:hypothetical protein